MAITSKSNSEHAPEDSENWFILVNAPATNGRYLWEEEKSRYRDLILEKLTSFGIDIRDAIEVEEIITPDDLATATGAWRGALYGISPNSPLSAFTRPRNRSNNVAGLYFAGGTTHPGGGVPMVTLSGKVAAEQILSDLDKK